MTKRAGDRALLRAVTFHVAGVALAVPVAAAFVALAATTLLGRSLVDALRTSRRGLAL